MHEITEERERDVLSVRGSDGEEEAFGLHLAVTAVTGLSRRHSLHKLIEIQHRKYNSHREFLD